MTFIPDTVWQQALYRRSIGRPHIGWLLTLPVGPVAMRWCPFGGDCSFDVAESLTRCVEEGIA